MSDFQETAIKPVDITRVLKVMVQAIPDEKLWSKEFSHATQTYLLLIKHMPSAEPDYQIPIPMSHLKVLLTLFLQLKTMTDEQEKAFAEFLTLIDDKTISGLKLPVTKTALLFSLKYQQETVIEPVDITRALKVMVQAIPDKKLWSKEFSRATQTYLFLIKYMPSAEPDYQLPMSHLKVLLMLFLQLKTMTDEQEKAFAEFLTLIDDKTINGLKLPATKTALLFSLKYQVDNYFIPRKKETINIDFITLHRSSIEIEGNFTWAKYADSTPPEIFAELDGELYAAQSYQERTENVTFLGHEVARKVEFCIRLPLEAIDQGHTVCILAKRNGIYMVPGAIHLGGFTPLSRELRNSYYAKNGWVLRFKNNMFQLTPGSASMWDELKLLKELFTCGLEGSKKAILARLLYHVLKHFKRHPIWILMDRANVANDNAEVLLDYIMTQPDDGTKYYFMISRKAPDYARLKKKFNVVPYLSYKHKMLLLLSDFTISSQHFVENYNPFFTYNQPYRDLLQNVNFIALDHGVKKDDLADRLSRYKKNAKLLVCSGKPEYESFLDGQYGYADGQVILTGLCRYDRLYDSSSSNKVIAIMPTWRKYLTEGIADRADGKMLLKKGFKKSAYFKFYKDLLTSERLLEVLRKYGYELDFVAHPLLAPYVKLFNVQSPVKIWGSEVVHRDIYARASLLVTDYSSVAFDFANLNKPIIYAQFDADEFWRDGGHRSKGYFDFERDGFGEITSTLDDTIDKIIEYIENGCVMAPEYRQRAEAFFKYHDRNNSQRVLNAILSLGGGGVKAIWRKLRDRIVRRILTILTALAFRMPTRRNILITCDMLLEPKTSTQDGFELFKYIYTQNQREFEPYYLMNADSEQYAEIKSIYGDHILGYDERKYTRFMLRLIWLFSHTKFICGGYMIMAALNLGIVEAVKRNPETYYIFLQHGVNFFKEDFITAASYSAFNFDKVMVSNEYEKQLFTRRGRFRSDDIIENGLLRWDLLAEREPPSQGPTIFIYFTHRRYLRKMEDASNSVYVNTIVALLRSPRLKELTQRYGLNIKVGVHHTVTDKLGTGIFDGIEVVRDEDIVNVKKEAAILITDYSSMCFEMWFQQKPVIFLNIPDSDDCLQYGSKTDLPYPYKGKEEYLPNRTEHVDECLDLLEHYLCQGFVLSEEDAARIDRFFYYRSDFCARLYHHLIELSRQTKRQCDIPFQRTLVLARHPYLYTEGFSLPNDGQGRWIVRKKASLGFYVPASNKALTVQITATPLLTRKQSQLRVEVYVNGHKAKEFCFKERKEHKLSFQVPQKWISPKNYMEITFQVHGCYRRNQISTANADDRRRLSLKLKTLRVSQRK